ncbi:MAG: hypothetical protein ACREE0_07025 [Phenylobacterium sp.]
MSVAPAVRPLTERQFFTGMAIAMAVAAFAGFAPTYYLAGLNDARTPVLTASVHVHGALNTAWMLLLITQTALIARGRPDIHRLTGMAGIVLAIGILVSGLLVAVGSERRVHTDANAGTMADPYVFLMFPLANVLLFAVFVGLGIANRGRSDVHKRLMLLATISLLGPALARIITQVSSIPGAIGALWFMDVFLVALVAYDLASRGRLHPATLWGGGLLLVSEPLRVAIAHTAPWQAFARSLMA